LVMTQGRLAGQHGLGRDGPWSAGLGNHLKSWI
jgi:hypothetical protein